MLTSGGGEVKGEPAARNTMRTKQKRILCRNKLQDKYSRHPSRALLTASKQFYICPSRNSVNDCHIFGQGDKANNDTDKNGTKIHMVSQLHSPHEIISTVGETAQNS